MKQFIIIITVTILAGCFGKEPIKTGKEGKPMPDFSLLLTDSTTWLHSKDIPQGKSSVIVLFSPFCPYCKAQTKKIVEDIDRLRSVQLYFISNFPFSTIKAFNKDFGLEKYPNITVGRDTANSLGNYLESTGVPYIAVFKKDKTLTRIFEGQTYIGQILKATEE